VGIPVGDTVSRLIAAPALPSQGGVDIQRFPSPIPANRIRVASQTITQLADGVDILHPQRAQRASFLFLHITCDLDGSGIIGLEELAVRQFRDRNTEDRPGEIDDRHQIGDDQNNVLSDLRPEAGSHGALISGPSKPRKPVVTL
jgi:hypothetical protein